MKKYLKKIIVTILEYEARIILARYTPRIVAVTGSVGKTSTKDAIFTVLSSAYYVRKSEKSYNSEIGIPLTVIGAPNAWSNPLLWLRNIFLGLKVIFFRSRYPEWLVLEVGADRPADIKNITRWLKPDVAVITRLSKVPVHVEFFSSPEAVFKEKGYLAEALKYNGVLVLNNDDEDVLAYREKTQNTVLTYGFLEGSDVRASNDAVVFEKQGIAKVPTGMTFRVDYKGNSVPITISGGLGKQHIYPTLAAIAVGLSQNINMVKMGEALKKHVTPKGRMRLIAGVKETFIIDDTYNSSPVALKEALETLSNIHTRKRKIAVLGDMLELGRYSTEEHKNAGKLASVVCDVLVTVGLRARDIAQGALGEGMDESTIFQFEDSREAGKFVEQLLEKRDIVLVKGSQSIRMERVVEEIMAHPEKSENLLVRQEEEWLRR